MIRRNRLTILVAVVLFTLMYLSGRAALSEAATFVGDPTVVAQVRAIETHVPGPAGVVRISRDACPGQPDDSGCWNGATAYLPDDSPYVVEHELGHAFDDRNLSGADRDALERAMGEVVPGTPWNLRATDPVGAPAGVDPCLVLACPDEQFADANASCALGTLPPHRYERRIDGELVQHDVDDWTTAYGWTPSLARNRAVCRLIRAMGAPERTLSSTNPVYVTCDVQQTYRWGPDGKLWLTFDGSYRYDCTDSPRVRRKGLR